MASAPIRPRFTHAGIYVRDIERATGFYTGVFNFVITDRGVGVTVPAPLVFLSSDPSHHHQLVLAGGRNPTAPSTINQLSFLVSSLDELRAMHDRAIAHGAREMKCVDHGVSWSIYFLDPEDNMLEIYLDTQWYIAQPSARPFDLHQSNDAIIQNTKDRCERDPTFQSLSDWSEKDRHVSPAPNEIYRRCPYAPPQSGERGK